MTNKKLKSSTCQHLMKLGNLCDVNGRHIAAALLALGSQFRYGHDRIIRIMTHFSEVTNPTARRNVADDIYHDVIIRGLDRVGISFRMVRDTVSGLCDEENPILVNRLAENLANFLIELNNTEGFGRNRLILVLCFMRSYKGDAIAELKEKYDVEIEKLGSVLPEIPDDFKRPVRPKTDRAEVSQIQKELNVLREIQEVNK